MEFVHDQFQYNASDHRSYGMINTPPPLIDIDAQNDVFYSLQGMMQNVQSTFESVHEWITYVAECVDSGDCLVIDLCLKYPRFFKCNNQGELVWIYLYKGRLSGHFNLSMIPRTVTYLELSHNKLSSINSQWHALRGKSLRCLDIRRNPYIVLDLNGLMNIHSGDRKMVPLRELVVTSGQISSYFGLRPRDPVGFGETYLKIRRWMKISLLDCLYIYAGGHNSKTRIKYFRNGTTVQLLPMSTVLDFGQHVVQSGYPS